MSVSEERIILKSSYCDACVWCEDGFYNPMCAHCPHVTYVKHKESCFMTREMAEFLNLVKPSEEVE